MKSFKVSVPTILTLLLLSVFNGIAFAGGPWKGRVVDVETKEPLEGSVVLAVWYRVYRTPYGDNDYFYRAYETMTDKDGMFTIPAYTPINLLPIISYMKGPWFTIFRPGYGGLNGLSLGDYLTNKGNGVQDFQINNKKYIFSPNSIALPRLRTWQERRESVFISPYGDVPEKKQQMLLDALERERKWLDKNTPQGRD